MEIQGSYRRKIRKKKWKANPDEVISVTLVTKHNEDVHDLVASGKRVTRREWAERFGATQADAARITQFATAHNLRVAAHLPRRSFVLTGKIKDMETAFGLQLFTCMEYNKEVRTREGCIHVPNEIGDLVDSVHGLETHKCARPMYRHTRPHHDHFFTSTSTFFPNILSQLYGFPNKSGAGQCIGIIELGGGYRQPDFNNFFNGRLGITAPLISDVFVDGATNNPRAKGDSVEVELDVEVAGAIANGAKIVVYFAPNTDQGFIDAFSTAIHDTTNNPTVISCSWGSSEGQWLLASLNSLNDVLAEAAGLGITICVASGDNGAIDQDNNGKVHVDFPASSPYSLAVGGTTCTVAYGAITSEVVWNAGDGGAGGGGVSEIFPLPTYQEGKGVPVSISTSFAGRGVPDVAAHAFPGYRLVILGKNTPVGGTSASAPLVAGLVALCNQKNGSNAGYLNAALYAGSYCRDITTGNNIVNGLGYTAGTGWDACTGLGVPSSLP